MKRVWHTGKLIKGAVALSPTDRGLTLGDGVFETIAVTGRVPLWRFEHLRRMVDGAMALGIPFPEYDAENAIDALTHRLTGHHVLRLTLTRGGAVRGLAAEGIAPTLFGTVEPFDPALRFRPVKLVTAKVRRNERSPASRLKALSYLDNILAAREAVALKADEALLLNGAGRIACAAVGNVFLVKGSTIVTPPVSEGALPGIMRGAVMAAARALDLGGEERAIMPKDALAADAMFLTNSLRFIRPVAALDGRRYRTVSKPVKMLMQALLAAEQQQITFD